MYTEHSNVQEHGIEAVDRTIHLSRKTPHCANCQHQLAERLGFERCNHPEAPVSIVSGYPQLTCDRARSGDPRHTDAICGPAGNLFEPSAS